VPLERVRILVLAKAPVPGAVKTRLAGSLGAVGAAELQRRMLRRVVALAGYSGIGPVELWCAPHADHPDFSAFAALPNTTLLSQVHGDLGQRMLHAARRALRGCDAVILVGSDCPALDATVLIRARRLLCGGCQAVLVGAEDGGYVLLGLRRVAARLFTDISWGGADVLCATRSRLRELRWSWLELAPLWDVDRPADLGRLRAVDSALLEGLG
jgi:rSAM/selenodomain-associated transferase 1